MKLKQRKSQARRRFGNPVLISIHFDDFTLPFTLSFLFRLRRYIKHSRQCFIGYPNTSNFVKNTPLRLVFSTPFSVFGYPDETLFLFFDILLPLSLSWLGMEAVKQCCCFILHTMVPSATRWGFNSASDAFSKQSLSGPWGVIILCRLPPPGENPSSWK